MSHRYLGWEVRGALYNNTPKKHRNVKQSKLFVKIPMQSFMHLTRVG